MWENVMYFNYLLLYFSVCHFLFPQISEEKLPASITFDGVTNAGKSILVIKVLFDRELYSIGCELVDLQISYFTSDFVW